MKPFFKSKVFAYQLGLVGLGLLIFAALTLIGPATGQVFSNIYSNYAPNAYPAAARNDAPANAPATPFSAAKSSGVLASPYRANRLIIKNAEMNLLVADTERAIDQIINLAVSSGGYVIGERSWMQDGLKFAALTIGVPSDQFEVVQRQVRAIGVQVLSATSSGQDVSDEYVDLAARQRNLEATAARIREFLGQATDAEQALLVNAKLSEVEAEIEQIKGRLDLSPRPIGLLDDDDQRRTAAAHANPHADRDSCNVAARKDFQFGHRRVEQRAARAG